MSPSVPILRARGLHKAYGGRPVTHDVSLDLHAGEGLALVGESGSGKSTIARMLLQLERPDAGAIELDGRDLLRSEPGEPSLAFRSAVQMVFQDPFASLNPVHTVRHHLERPLRRHGRIDGDDSRTAVETLLSLVGLEPARRFIDAYPGELSGGQRQRVAIARALAVQPSVLVADEPTSMLDASVRTGILTVLDQLVRERQLALLLITHDLASARLLCDRVAVLYAGRVVESGPMTELLSHPAHPYTAALLAALPRAAGRPPAPPRSASPPRGGNPSGCRYRPRCHMAVAACDGAEPGLVSVGRNRQVRCHLASTI